MKTSTLKSLLAIVVPTLLIFSLLFLMKGHFDEFGPIHIIAGVMGVIFLFSIIVRKNARFQPYFTSDFNIFTSKVKHKQELDFPKDLLLEKLIEVLQTAGFNIVRTNKITGDIFATSPTSIFSWGENIYIHLTEEHGKTTIDFCSACLFQIYSWGKNNRNYENLFEEFEKSLII